MVIKSWVKRLSVRERRVRKALINNPSNPFVPTMEQLKRRKVAEALAKRVAEKRAKEQWEKLKKEEKERIEIELEMEEERRKLEKKKRRREELVGVVKRVGETIARGLRGYAREFEKATNGGR